MSKLARKSETVQPEEIEAPSATVKLGDWYWLAVCENDDEEEPITNRRLVCVMHIGTNFVEVKTMSERHVNSTSSWRVHFNDFDDLLTPEPDAADVWAQRGAATQARIAAIMHDINELTATLSLNPSQMLAQSNETQALAQLGDVDVDGYKAELAHTKEQLPKLFEQMELEHKQLAQIMTMHTLPMRAQVGDLKTLVNAIDARVLNVDLYAGLSEDMVKFRDGEPAAYDERLCVRQRMLFMDEECLPFYTAGGMKFKNIHAFDRWLCEDDRFRLILPEPRCVVAFRVRRNRRQYDGPDDIGSFIQFWHEQENDMRTFLYIRNGEQLYWLETKFDFGEQLFPNAAALSTGEELMMTRSENPEIVTRREWEAMAEERRAGALAKREEGRKSHAEHAGKKRGCGPWCWHHAETDEDIEAVVDRWRARWAPFTPDSVYYDDANAIIAKDVAHYNRVALILQGLFDRSACLHPHPPVKTWSAEGFDRAIKLVYDDGLAIAPADKPDWQAYWTRCNASLKSPRLYASMLKTSLRSQVKRHATVFGLSRQLRGSVFRV